MTIGDAVRALGIEQWAIRGEPTNEQEFNSMFFKIIGEDENRMAIESSDPADFGVTWTQVKAKYDELVAAEPIKRLRAERDRRLAEVDWVTLKAYSQGVAVPTDYATYQQALRDITETYQSLDTVVWPTKP